MKKKAKIILLCVFIFALVVCVTVLAGLKLKQPKWTGAEFYEYSAYEELLQADVTLYMGLKHNKVYAILKGHINEIDADCSLCFVHDCSEQQFELARKKIETEYADEFHGTTKTPDLQGYPDLSCYINFIMNAEERHELWQTFGIE